MAVGNSLLGQNLAPGVLGVVQDESDEIHQRLFLLVADGIGLGDHGAAGARRVGAEKRQKVALENQAEHEKHDDAAQSEMNASGLEAASAAFVAAIFNVVAASAG